MKYWLTILLGICHGAISVILGFLPIIFNFWFHGSACLINHCSWWSGLNCLPTTWTSSKLLENVKTIAARCNCCYNCGLEVFFLSSTLQLLVQLQPLKPVVGFFFFKRGGWALFCGDGMLVLCPINRREISNPNHPITPPYIPNQHLTSSPSSWVQTSKSQRAKAPSSLRCESSIVGGVGFECECFGSSYRSSLEWVEQERTS